MQTLPETNQEGEEKNILKKKITLFFNNLIAIYNHKIQVESNKEQQVVRKEQNSTLGGGKTHRISSRLKKTVLEEKKQKKR